MLNLVLLMRLFSSGCVESDNRCSGSTEVHCGIQSLSLRPVVFVLVCTQAFGLLHKVDWDEGDLLLSSEPVGKHHLLLHVHVRIRAAEGTEGQREILYDQLYSNTDAFSLSSAAKLETFFL